MPAAHATTQTFVLSPHSSLDQRAAIRFFLIVCAGSFGVALLLTLRGFWPVLPFAGLEMLVLGWALWISMQRGSHVQVITVTAEQVSIESRNGKHHETIVFARHWSQVKLRRAELTLHPSRLTIESHGQSFEVGKFLTDGERRSLAERLARSIGRMNESPPIEAAGLQHLRPE